MSPRGGEVFEVFAPARVDLAGGTLDLWPLWCFHPGSVTINVALSIGVRLRLTPGGAPAGLIRHRLPTGREALLRPSDAGRDLTAAVAFHFVPAGGLLVEVVEQLPIGSGLGGSSTYAVALARACLAAAGRKVSPAALVACLRDIEARVLAAPTGVQDYWPAIAGGPLAISFAPGGEHVERLTVPGSWLADRMLLFDSGIAHVSGLVNWQVYRARVDGDRAVAASLDAISTAAQRCRAALLAADEAGVGAAIAAEWAARRTLAPAVEPPEIARIVAAGVAAGALAAKACGAGGGGSVVFWTPPLHRAAVRRAVLAAAPSAAREFDVALVRRPPAVRPRVRGRRQTG